jgi:hypothetical protein
MLPDTSESSHPIKMPITVPVTVNLNTVRILFTSTCLPLRLNLGSKPFIFVRPTLLRTTEQRGSLIALWNHYF